MVHNLRISAFNKIFAFFKFVWTNCFIYVNLLCNFNLKYFLRDKFIYVFNEYNYITFS